MDLEMEGKSYFHQLQMIVVEVKIQAKRLRVGTDKTRVPVKSRVQLIHQCTFDCSNS